MHRFCCNRMHARVSTSTSIPVHVRSTAIPVCVSFSTSSPTSSPTSSASSSSTSHNAASPPPPPRPRAPSRWTPRSTTTTTTPPRRHHLDHIPSLKDFMLRADVLSLYRNVWRLTKPLDETKRAEIRSYARVQIDNVKHVRDSQQIRMQLTQGKWQLEELQKMINMTS